MSTLFQANFSSGVICQMPKVEFRTVTFKETVLDLSDRATVLDAKRQLASKMGCGPEALVLVVSGRPLMDKSILSSVSTARGDRAPLVYRLPWFPVHAPAGDEPKKDDPPGFNGIVDDILSLQITRDRRAVEAALRNANYDRNAATEALLSGGAPAGPPMESPGGIPKDIRERLMKAKRPGVSEADAIKLYQDTCDGDIKLAETLLREG
jgi:hypothetical protein